MSENNRPKVGIALSGASGRAIAHVGVLEVFKENNIPIDYIVGCSSGAIIASSFATNTLPLLKENLESLTIAKMLSYWTTKDASGGLFQMRGAEPLFTQFTHGLSFEDIKSPKLGFVAADIDTGELVNITSGKLIDAIKAAVAVPGLFEPAIIGNRVLVDGGLVNIVPTKAAREMGADIVIGVNIAATKFIYEKRLPIWRGYRFITRLLGLQFFREKIWPKLASRIFFQFDSQSDALVEEDIKVPGLFTTLAKALDHSLEVSERWTDSEMACDLMIEPRVKHFGKTEFENIDKIYMEGRRAALHALPKIRAIIQAHTK